MDAELAQFGDGVRQFLQRRRGNVAQRQRDVSEMIENPRIVLVLVLGRSERKFEDEDGEDEDEAF
jgi:hypothetical protein